MQLSLQNILPLYFDKNGRDSEIWQTELLIKEGDYVKIVAPSGSGKTSLIHFLYGMRNEYSGNILYDKKNIRSFGAEEFASLRKNEVSIVFQDLRLFPEQTVFQNLEIKRQLNPFHRPEKIQEMADRLGIANKLSSHARICSYGEQQRIAIIRALLQPFSILLLDEPFSHLDNRNSELAMELMLEESKIRT
ncbi:MAG TPA: ATP-binding cassette domain-containing protein, partial [Flavitalea sp.]|nr:ATP-binding cassette domain-containing protein [Flavitalea sp.]